MDRFTRYASARHASLLILGVAAIFVLAGCQSAQVKSRNEGIGLYNQGDFAGAQVKFKEALKQDEFSAVDNYYAGSAAFKLEKYEQAAYHFKLAWQADPSMPEVKQALTETLIRQGKPDLALNFLERDAELTAKVQDPRPRKALAYKRGYYWQTEEKMVMGKAGDRIRIAKVYENLGDMDNAKAYYQQAMQLAPRDTEIMLAYAMFCERLNDKATAINVMKDAYRIKPMTPGLVEAMTRNGVLISEVISPGS